jgi:mannose-6-phosphate isomerase-like protein (cupin superfamily)
VICRPHEGDEFLSSENVFILENWNHADDPALSVARARLAPGECTQEHVLVGTAERYLVVRGTGEVRVGALPASTVQPGDVVYIPPGTVQSICNTGTGDLVFYCICTPAFSETDYRRVTVREDRRE